MHESREAVDGGGRHVGKGGWITSVGAEQPCSDAQSVPRGFGEGKDVDATTDGDEARKVDASVDLALGESHTEHLPSSDDPALSRHEILLKVLKLHEMHSNARKVRRQDEIAEVVAKPAGWEVIRTGEEGWIRTGEEG